MDAHNLVSVQNKETGQLQTFDMITGEEVFRDGRLVKDHQFIYTVEDGMQISALVREGKTLKQIASLPDAPSLHLIYAWRRMHPDFAKSLADAKADRAEYFRDKAVELLDQKDLDEDGKLKVAKFKFDGYTKLAAQDNPAEFGQKREDGGSAPTQIIIQTGVPLGEQPIIEVNADGTLKENKNLQE